LSGNELFQKIIDVQVIAMSEECHFACDPLVDCANRSALGDKARALNIPSDHALIVEGAFGHVNFICRPKPHMIDVVDLVPPESRLLDLAQKALQLGDLPPI